MNYRFSVTIISSSMKPTLRTLILSLLVLATFPALAQSAASPPTHTFATQGDQFTLDGKPFKILSGELHYARIPREYWRARLKMAHAMGLNTIATYVFWNVHEPTPNHFNFSGNADLAEFIREAQQEGLYVILRAGPYSCAEWEFGGFPAWLMADPKMPQVLRSNDPAFMVPAERWIHRLAQEVASLQLGNSGPILMTQVENEYGNFDSDHAYMQHLKQIFEDAGFTKSLLYSADNWRNIPNGSIPGLFAATNFGIGNHQGGMDALERLRPNQPLFVSEYWPGWFDAWGRPHETRPVPQQLEDVDYILQRGTGINIYMFHGGSSFGFMSGATGTRNGLLPDVTSYDYDAPLDESGYPTPKYFAYRKLLAKYACVQSSTDSEKDSSSRPNPEQAKRVEGGVEGPPHFVRTSDPGLLVKTATAGDESCLPPVPNIPPAITIETFTLTESTPLWQNLPTPIATEQPQSMEHFGQSYGYILYRTQLAVPYSGDLVLADLHDYAQVYIDGKLIGSLDRRHLQYAMPLTTTAPARLDILVANDGRINSTKQMRGESMGITKSVTLAGHSITNWQVYPLPMTTLPGLYVKPRMTSRVTGKTGSHTWIGEPGIAPGSNASPFIASVPAFYRGHFTLTTTGDTFLDIRSLSKGAIWINGHPIGRFWKVGPQQTLYVPGPWLRQGDNEVVVFDLASFTSNPTAPGNPNLTGLHSRTLTGLAEPILNGPVPDQATRPQQE